MKIGLATSVIGHALVVAWGVISLPSADPFQTDPVEALPVDIVSIEEFSKLTKGVKTGDEEVKASAAEQTPEPKETEIETPGRGETIKPSEVEARPSREIAALAPAPPPAEPEPEAEKVEAAPPPEPAPRQAEPAVAEPEPEVAKPDPDLAKAPAPRKRPKPPKKVQVASANPKPERKAKKRSDNKKPPDKDRPEFDSEQVSALLNKVDPASGGARQSTDAASQGRASGRDQIMTQSELDALRAQIIPCFSPPVGAAGAEDIVVALLMSLDEDGSVIGRPRIVNSGTNPYFRPTADAAVRAVLRCAPYRLPEEKYAAWNEVKVNFGLRDIVVGY